MDARAITKALGGKWQGPFGLCRCPVHVDKTPSLKVRDDARKSDGVDLHCFAGCDWRDIKDALKRQGLLPEFQPGRTDKTMAPPKETMAPPPEIIDTGNIKRAEDMWRSAKPLPGTLGCKYFTERRGLHIDALDSLDHALRWHHGLNAVVALMTDALTNEAVGVHRTFLNADGSKRDRMMLGRQGVIRLSPDEDVTQGLGITEGIETALAVLLSGWAPLWAATSAGAIERFPVLPGIESLTIFADDDTAGAKAARACAERWILAGREARIAQVKDAF